MSTAPPNAPRPGTPAHLRPRRRAGRRRGRLVGAVGAVGAAVALGGVVAGRLRATSAATRESEATSLSAPARRAILPPPLAQPTAARPLGILEIGDSLGEDLGFGLEGVLGRDPRVVLHTEAVGDTGLANVAYYNWPATFERELRTFHPGLVVVFIGGNDAQGFDVGSRPALFGTPFWRAAYAARVRTMMAEATAAGAHVLWVGMPVMGPGTGLSPDMAKLDAIYASVARSFPLVRYLSTWRLLETSSGQFATSLPNGSGQLVTVRDPDGVHLTGAGGDLAARAVVGAVRADWHVRL